MMWQQRNPSPADLEQVGFELPLGFSNCAGRYLCISFITINCCKYIRHWISLDVLFPRFLEVLHKSHCKSWQRRCQHKWPLPFLTVASDDCADPLPSLNIWDPLAARESARAKGRTDYKLYPTSHEWEVKHFCLDVCLGQCRATARISRPDKSKHFKSRLQTSAIPTTQPDSANSWCRASFGKQTLPFLAKLEIAFVMRASTNPCVICICWTKRTPVQMRWVLAASKSCVPNAGPSWPNTLNVWVELVMALYFW